MAPMQEAGLLLLLLSLQSGAQNFDPNPKMHSSDEFEGGLKVGDTIGGIPIVGDGAYGRTARLLPLP